MKWNSRSPKMDVGKVTKVKRFAFLPMRVDEVTVVWLEYFYEYRSFWWGNYSQTLRYTVLRRELAD